jgi:hypothetical protein
VTTLVPLIPKSPGNAYRGIGEVVYRNLESLWPSIEKMDRMDRALVYQYVEEILEIRYREEEEEND